MESYELAAGGSLYHFDTGAFNWYVICQEGRLTVIDTGFPAHYEIFLKGIHSLGYDISDVAAILLTHAHADHMGFAEHLRRETNAPVFAHADDLDAVQRVLQLPWGGMLINAWRPPFARVLGQAALKGVFITPRIAKAYPINDGDRLDLPGNPQVIHLPGHTPGEAAFYLPDSDVLLSGDAIITYNLLTGLVVSPQVPVPSLSNDTKAACRSLERLSDLGTVTVLPGHGKSWRGPISEIISRVPDIQP